MMARGWLKRRFEGDDGDFVLFLAGPVNVLDCKGLDLKRFGGRKMKVERL